MECVGLRTDFSKSCPRGAKKQNKSLGCSPSGDLRHRITFFCPFHRKSPGPGEHDKGKDSSIAGWWTGNVTLVVLMADRDE